MKKDIFHVISLIIIGCLSPEVLTGEDSSNNFGGFSSRDFQDWYSIESRLAQDPNYNYRECLKICQGNTNCIKDCMLLDPDNKDIREGVLNRSNEIGGIGSIGGCPEGLPCPPQPQKAGGGCEEGFPCPDYPPKEDPSQK